MAKHVVLTQIAEHDLEQITDYLLANWNGRVCEAFLVRFEDICDLISNNPEIYPFISRKKKIRKCVLTRQNTMYFREHHNQVEVITIFDTRQDPGKLNKIITNV